MADFTETRGGSWLAAVHISKHSLVGCRLSAYPSIHVETLRITVGSRLCCVVLVWCWCVHLVWWRVCMYMWRCVYMWWCGVVVCGVVRLGMRKNHPCVDSKRPRVYVQNVTVYAGNTRTCFSACGRGAGTHGDVLNLHTVRREELFSSLCVSLSIPLSLSFSRPFSLSLSFSSVVLLPSSSSFSFLFLFLFSLLFLSLLFSLSNNDNDHSSSRFSLCTHGFDL